MGTAGLAEAWRDSSGGSLCLLLPCSPVPYPVSMAANCQGVLPLRPPLTSY